MKMRFMFGLGAVLALSVASQAHAELEYGGYFRSGTGFNSLGGKQKCFTNTGTSGNEFRLGNECGSYGEASFTYNFAKGKAKESFFKLSMKEQVVIRNLSKFMLKAVMLMDCHLHSGQENGSIARATFTWMTFATM